MSKSIRETTHTGDDVPVRVRLRSMTGTQRIAYLWYYFKWPALIALFALILLVWFVHDWLAAGNTDTLLTVTLVNAAPLENLENSENSDLFADFLARYLPDRDTDILLDHDTLASEIEQNPDPDPGTYTVYVDDTLYIDLDEQDARTAQSFQVLAAQFAVGEIDLFVSYPALFERMAANGGFLPLTDLFSEAQLHTWGERVLYRTDPDTGLPEPCGLRLTDSPLQNAGYYPTGADIVLGIGARSSDPDAAAQLLLYLDRPGAQ